ncbi:MAG: Flp family type IVb pilin [Chloroflexi bacterium]|nr:Flp family type IVb pilin [Chloroflexota bacterium]MBU1751790.1 Flp family type IVb pilin [Chloroflexota bacterium]
MIALLRQFLQDERGQVATEYIMILALVVLVLAAIMATIFGNLQTKFRAINDNL